MRSPFTGGETTLRTEERKLTFRKEQFTYIHQCYVCNDTGEAFTTTEQDEVNILQVYNQYRTKYGIPFPDDIRRIRLRYGLPASKMSRILGFGDNQYRLYENGDMPSETNGKILASIATTAVFKVFVENAKNQFPDDEYAKITKKIGDVANDEKAEYRDRLIFGNNGRNVFNGYAAQSYDKLRSTVLYLIKGCGETYITKMNKMLFYADFISYKRYGRGMTGLSYRAIQHGPVPTRWDRVYSLLDGIDNEERLLPSGICGYVLSSNDAPDMDCLSEEDKIILDEVIRTLGAMSASEISSLSHKEDAWIKYNQSSSLIPYSEAFFLND